VIAVAGLAPVEELGAVLQLVAGGTFAGTLVAVRRRRRDPEADTFGPVACGGVAGGMTGAVIVLIEALL